MSVIPTLTVFVMLNSLQMGSGFLNLSSGFFNLSLRKCCPKDQLLNEWNQCVKAPLQLELEKLICQNLTSCNFEEKTGFGCAIENRVEHRLDEQLSAKIKNESCLEMAMFGQMLEEPFLVACNSSLQYGMFIY